MLAHFELTAFVPTLDAERAKLFYVETLGLTLVSDDKFAIVVRAHEADVRIVRVESFTPAAYTILGWKVPSMENAIRQLSARSVVFERFPFLEQDKDGVWDAPGGTRVAWFKDPDGNMLSLAQSPGA